MLFLSEIIRLKTVLTLLMNVVCYIIQVTPKKGQEHRGSCSEQTYIALVCTEGSNDEQR